jgi:hypothetical protein
MSTKKARGLAVPNPNRRRCTRIKRDGDQCGNPPIKGGTVCRMHGGSAPQVKEIARARLLEAADSLMANLLKIAASAESEAVRLAAVRDALDRAGLGAAQMHKLSLAQPWDDLLQDLVDDHEIFEDAPPRPRGLPPGRGGGEPVEDPDHEASDPVQIIDYPDPDADLTGDDLSFNTPGTIPGEVVRGPSEQQLARGRAAFWGRPDPDEYAEYSDRPALADDPNRPPQHVREAMEAAGEDWRAPGSRAARGVNVTWTP